jgi:hypothetical protein
MKVIAIENNGGGIQFEQYDDNGNLISVVAGLEFAEEGKGVDDIKTYGDEWFWNDCGGNTIGYSQEENTSGDRHYDTGEILTAKDVKDEQESSCLVAEWTSGELTLHKGAMGRAAQAYFGVEKD